MERAGSRCLITVPFYADVVRTSTVTYIGFAGAHKELNIAFMAHLEIMSDKLRGLD
jgi:hypothetical protein